MTQSTHKQGRVCNIKQHYMQSHSNNLKYLATIITAAHTSGFTATSVQTIMSHDHHARQKQQQQHKQQQQRYIQPFAHAACRRGDHAKRTRATSINTHVCSHTSISTHTHLSHCARCWCTRLSQQSLAALCAPPERSKDPKFVLSLAKLT